MRTVPELVQRGTAQEVRQSLGARISRPIATEHSGWDYDNEGLWQFGTFGSRNIRAWTIATETGYRFPTVPSKPRFSVKADISSGGGGDVCWCCGRLDNPKTLRLHGSRFFRRTVVTLQPRITDIVAVALRKKRRKGLEVS
jgi:hypothetical protein